MNFYFFPGGGPPPPPLDPIDELVGDVLGQDSKVITGFEEIDDLGHQRTVDMYVSICLICEVHSLVLFFSFLNIVSSA